MSNVYVGMSGGVDSSVSAALLKEAGHTVTGVFIKTWHPDFLACDWRSERHDAMRVCAHLGIPFETLDLEAEYKRDVADYMIAEYKAGRTPNPDVMCNRYIKFGAFFDYAREKGADMIATGHYARTQQKAPSAKHHMPEAKLLAGVDANKDQSYFLWTLPQDVLAHVMFPVGNLTKPEVRALAKDFGLPVATKKDSQGVCFLGHVEMKEFLTHYIEAKPGEVVNEAGEAIGTHDGALLYTLGERHGFTVTKKGPNDGPWYVIAKDIKKNTLTVSHERGGTDNSHAVSHVALQSVAWVSGETPDTHIPYTCRFRYRQPLFGCRIEETASGTSVRFDTPQTAVAPGQSVVIYSGEEVVGGGIIQSTQAE